MACTRPPLTVATLGLLELQDCTDTVPLLDMAAAVYGRMRTFQDIQIEEYRPLS